MSLRNSSRAGLLALMWLYYPFLALICLIAGALAVACFAAVGSLPGRLGLLAVLPVYSSA